MNITLTTPNYYSQLDNAVGQQKLKIKKKKLIWTIQLLLRSLMLLKDDLKRLQIIKKKFQRKASLCYDWLLSLGNKLLHGLKITLL